MNFGHVTFFQPLARNMITPIVTFALNSFQDRYIND